MSAKSLSSTLQRTPHGQQVYFLFKKTIRQEIFYIANSAAWKDCPMHVEIQRDDLYLLYTCCGDPKR